MDQAGFSSEGEGLHALEFVNSFGFWCERGEFVEFFLCRPEQLLLSLEKINTLVFSDKFILKNLLTRKEIFLAFLK